MSNPPCPRNWRALTGTGLAVLVGGLLAWHGQHRVAWVIFPLACLFFLLAVCLPQAWAPIQALLDRLAKVLLTVCSWIALGLVFVMVFIPGRILLILLRKDPLHRRFDPALPSYWTSVGCKRDHRRQF